MAATDELRLAAYQAVVTVWSGVASGGSRLGTDDYDQLRGALLALVRARFPLSPEKCAEAVEVVLDTFLPPLLVRYRYNGPSGPENVLSDLDDVALDVMLGVDPAEIAAQRFMRERPDDEDLVQRAFCVDVARYQAALCAALVAGCRAEFLVVTEYVSQYEVYGSPPRAEEIATNLPGTGLDVLDVLRCLQAFRTRLSALPSR